MTDVRMWMEPEHVQRPATARTPDELERLWGNSSTRVLAVDERGGVFLAPNGELELVAPQGPFSPETQWLLGILDGVAYFSTRVGGRDGVALRDASRLPDDQFALATTAVALAQWHDREPFCARCGGPTDVASGGFSRRCERCGTDLFPRHDPAMIVAVLDADDRLLMGHQASWPAGRFSVLAGFCEAGESLEQTVHREAFEEVGVRLSEVRYLASQPWPMPRSLMFAFVARAVDTDLTPDGSEITEARWFSRQEFNAEIAAGTISRPASRSVSAWMINRWLDGDLTV